MQIVNGLTTPDINAAIAAAGPGGEVRFPAGVYMVENLQATQPGQTWIFEPGATLKRVSGNLNPVLDVKASLRMVGGIIDGNRASASVEAQGVVADGFDLNWTGDWIVRDAWVGVLGKNNKMFVTDGRTENTGYMGVYWVTTANVGGQTRPGPTVERVTVDRRVGYVVGGGIIINGGALAVNCNAARVNGNFVWMPVLSSVALRDNPTYYAAVGVELNRCYHGQMIGNYVNGGRIGVSSAECPWIIQSMNHGTAQGDYGVEVVNAEHGTVTGNMFTGYPGVSRFGTVVSGPLSKGLNIVGNNTRVFFGTSVYVYPNASNFSYPHVITGNH